MNNSVLLRKMSKRYIFFIGLIVAAILHAITISISRRSLTNFTKDVFVFPNNHGIVTKSTSTSTGTTTTPAAHIKRREEQDDTDDHVKALQPLIREKKESTTSVSWRTPTMHTFYEPVPGGCCGMSQGGHLRLLSTWEESWQAKGWQTRILNETDARSHLNYVRLRTALERLNVDEYNRRCFYRWLAMSQVGGWMSDYDTMPLHFTSEVGSKLAQNGEFSSLEGHIPSLIQANQQEWERVTQMMIELLEVWNQDEMVSDMFVLEKIKKSMGSKAGRFARYKTLIIPGLAQVYSKIDDENNRQILCGATRNKLAIHFSHMSTAEAFNTGKFPIKSGVSTVRDAMERRSSAASIFLQDYEDQCIEEGDIEEYSIYGTREGVVL